MANWSVTYGITEDEIPTPSAAASATGSRKAGAAEHVDAGEQQHRQRWPQVVEYRTDQEERLWWQPLTGIGALCGSGHEGSIRRYGLAGNG